MNFFSLLPSDLFFLHLPVFYFHFPYLFHCHPSFIPLERQHCHRRTLFLFFFSRLVLFFFIFCDSLIRLCYASFRSVCILATIYMLTSYWLFILCRIYSNVILQLLAAHFRLLLIPLVRKWPDRAGRVGAFWKLYGRTAESMLPLLSASDSVDWLHVTSPPHTHSPNPLLLRHSTMSLDN